MEKQYFPTGMTIKELKTILDKLPEEDINGEPCEVWISSGLNISKPVLSIMPLNQRTNGANTWSDLLWELLKEENGC